MYWLRPLLTNASQPCEAVFGNTLRRSVCYHTQGWLTLTFQSQHDLHLTKQGKQVPVLITDMTLIYQLITKPEQINKTNKPASDRLVQFDSVITTVWVSHWQAVRRADWLHVGHMAKEVKGYYGVIGTKQPQLSTSWDTVQEGWADELSSVNIQCVK